MENSSAANTLLWEERQRADRAQGKIEDREWLKNFALLFALIVIAVSVAAILAKLGANGAIR
jgi:hypothetical protein